jgi:acetyltransferase
MVACFNVRSRDSCRRSHHIRSAEPGQTGRRLAHILTPGLLTVYPLCSQGDTMETAQDLGTDLASAESVPHSLDAILKPGTVAVIGASRSRDAIGHQIVVNLLTHGFTGPVFPINPHALAIHSVRCYPSVRDVPDAVDLAVIAVPADRVVEVAAECGEAGVRGLVVVTAGFREIGASGAEREQQLLAEVRRFDMRLVGPNCIGVLNTDPEYSLNATFAPCMPPNGRIAFLSQSGALGLSVLDYAREYGIGISQFVSVGNKPDVSGNDLLEYWEDDPQVSAILMYVESFGNPIRFREIAARVSRKKPILVLKSGRSRSGARAASSHTGALAADERAVDALLAQAGVLRAASMEELFDMAMAFAGQPLPRSSKTAIITNSGGPGILAADALDTAGIELATLHKETLTRLAQLLPREASIRNPLDLIATARPPVYRAALEALLADQEVDAVVAIFVPPLGIRQEEVADAIVAATEICRQKPVLAVLMGREGLPQGRAELHLAGVPAYIFPESAARALGALNRYRSWLERPVVELEPLPVDRANAKAIIDRALQEKRVRLTSLEALELASAYGIPVVPSRMAHDGSAAAKIASELGFPVVMKIDSPDIIHKSDVGGVALGIASEAEARDTYERLVRIADSAVPGSRIHGVLIQRQLSGGIETIAGLSRDPLFGPLVMFGLGGVYVEALRDVVFRLAPIDPREADEMVRAIRSASILLGVRGRPAANLADLANLLRRLSQLAGDFPQIIELDLNPVLARDNDAVALDARVSLGEATN